MEDTKVGVRAGGGVIALIGFLLSPLSWWNDLVINFPFSYILALPFGWINRSFFLPAFITAYWFTNILGLFLMQKGCKRIVKPEEQIAFKAEVRKTLMWGTVYTGIIVALVLLGVLEFPEEFIDKISAIQ